MSPTVRYISFNEKLEKQLQLSISTFVPEEVSTPEQITV